MAISDGVFFESYPAPNLGGGSLNGFVAARERTGTYTVAVKASGFRDWIREDTLHRTVLLSPKRKPARMISLSI